MAIYHVRTREEAIARYSAYFDMKYNTDDDFRNIVDEIYEKYRNGEDIYLECYCKPLPCHGDIIAEKLQRRLLREKIKEVKNKRNEMGQILSSSGNRNDTREDT